MKTKTDKPIKVKSSKLPHDRLPCFSEIEWSEWAITANVTRAQKNPCFDCSVSHRDSMTSRGLCKHPETIFVEMRSGGDIIPSCGISSLDKRCFKGLLLGRPIEKIIRIKNQPAFSFLAPYFRQYMAE